MSGAVSAVKEVLEEAGNLRLPATSKFFAKSSLDDEEEARGEELGFLSTNRSNERPKAKQSQPSVQGDWSALEATLSLDDRSIASPDAPEQKSDWHEIPVVRMTPELEKDLRIIENRQHLDPKRFYKSSGTGRRKGELPNRVHFGTVVVGAHEFYSGRLTRRERRSTIMDEIMTDDHVMNYTKAKFKNLQVARKGNKRVVDPAARKQKKRKRQSGGW